MPQKQASLKPSEIGDHWRSLLRLIPGYDPIETAEEGQRFCPALADRVIGFFHECLRHVEGDMAGKPFQLQPWQQSFVANLFGWIQLDSYNRWVRRYRETLLYVPRKNGKTPLVAGIALYMFFCDDEKGQQNYIAAAEKNQAWMLFRQAKGMVEQEPELRSRCSIYGGHAADGQSKSIVKPDGSYTKIISADANTQHGGNPHLVIIDELHTQPNRDLVDVLKTSMASANRRQSLFVSITTADFFRPSICNEKLAFAKAVRDGQRKDSSFLPVIYELPQGEDWTLESSWEKANPNIDVSVSRDYLRREVENVKGNTVAENALRRLHLNQQTQSSVKAIPMESWAKCGGNNAHPREWRKRTEDTLAGRECIGGLDIGSTSDLTALALLFRTGDVYTVLPYFWVPRETAESRSKRDKVPYLNWLADGYVLPTEGDVTDYAQIRRDIDAITGRYRLLEIAVDRVFQGVEMCTALQEEGYKVIAFGQGYLSMGAPTKRFLELVKGGKIEHGNNPVLSWMAANACSEAAVRKNETGKADEVLKFSKERSSEKIDGIIATVMALGRWLVRPDGWKYTPGSLLG